MEVTYLFTNYGFTVRVPSHLYLNKTEGLCGNCNGDVDDDLTKPDGMLADDADQFGLSWLVKSLLDQPYALPAEDVCQVIPQKECDLLPPSEDPCFQLIDSHIFQVDIKLFFFFFVYSTIIFGICFDVSWTSSRVNLQRFETLLVSFSGFQLDFCF